MKWSRFLQFSGNRNPWQGRSDGDSPPDLDELFSNLSGKINKWFGSGNNNGKGNNSGGGHNNHNNNGGRTIEPGNLPARFILTAVSVVLLAVWFAAGFYTINEKERAVVLRLGKYHDTLIDI